MSFIFGGNTGVTAEDIKRKRSVAEALMAQQSRLSTPMEGLRYAGGKIAGALLAKRADRETAEKRKEAMGEFDSLFGDQPAAVGAAPPQSGMDFGAVEAAIENPPIYAAIEQVESGGNPNAVSPKGATGAMQIMPATARDPGFGVPNIFAMAREMGRPVADESDATLNGLLRDPEVNRAFGARYFDAMMKQNGGDQDLALASYNAGPGAVEQYGGIPPFEETQNYVQAVNSRLEPQAVASASAAPQMPPQPAAQPAQGGLNAAMLARLAGNEFLPEAQRSVVQAMLTRMMTPPEQMSPYQQAQLDMRRQEMEMRRAGQWSPGTNVSVTNNAPEPVNPMDEANASARGKGLEALAKSAIDTFNEGRNAATQIAQIDQLEGLLAQTPTGTLPAWQAWATEVLGVQANGGPAQAANAIINALIPAQRPPGSGSSSDRDVAMFRASLPGLVNTPEGNAEIIAGMRAIAEYKAEISRIAGDATAGVVPYADGSAETDMIRQMREADARLSAALRARREAMPDMYGKGESPDELRKQLGELRGQ